MEEVLLKIKRQEFRTRYWGTAGYSQDLPFANRYLEAVARMLTKDTRSREALPAKLGVEICAKPVSEGGFADEECLITTYLIGHFSSAEGNVDTLQQLFYHHQST